MGMDPSKDACENFKAKCVVVTKDISPKSLKEIKYVCDNKGIPVLRVDSTMDEIWEALGRKAVVLAVCDTGFSKKLSQMLETVDSKV